MIPNRDGDARFRDEGALARRLAEVRVPGRERVVAGAIARFNRPARRHRGRVWVLAVAAVVVAAGLVAASPAAPAITGPAAAALALAGIGPRAAHEVQVPRDHGQLLRATSAGHTVTLGGAYGDATRTVVFLHLDTGWQPGTLALADESGRQLSSAAGGGTSAQGDVIEVFGPLPPGQHRLTLRLWSLLRGPQAASPGPRLVTGTWTFSFPLGVSDGRVGVSPRTGTVAGVTVTVSAVAGDGYVLDVSFETVGATLDELDGSPPNEAEGRQGQVVATPPSAEIFQAQVFDGQGRPLANIHQEAGVAGKAGTGLSDVNWQTYWAGGHGPGTYRLILTWRGQRMESTFTIH